MEPTTGKAKYYTLMEALKEQILSGTIKPGQKLPSENELTREYALSRHTVRKALALLENEGYITAQHGKGTFCSERVIQRHNSKNIAVTTTNPNLSKDVVRVNTSGSHFLIQKDRSTFEEENSVFLVHRRSGRAILLPFYRVHISFSVPRGNLHRQRIPKVCRKMGMHLWDASFL